MELPAFVVLDSEDRVVGQVVGFEEASTTPWRAIVLVRRGEEKIVLRLAIEGNLQSPYTVWYEQPGCNGIAKMEFDTTNDPWILARGVIHGVGLDQLVYRATATSESCVSARARSHRHLRHPICVEDDSEGVVLFSCVEAEETGLDLDELFVLPFRIE